MLELSRVKDYYDDEAEYMVEKPSLTMCMMELDLHLTGLETGRLVSNKHVYGNRWSDKQSTSFEYHGCVFKITGNKNVITISKLFNSYPDDVLDEIASILRFNKNKQILVNEH